MYFSRARIGDSVMRTSRMCSTFRDQYTLHRSVWRLFGDRPDRKRDFLYRVERDSCWPVVYIVSERPPATNDRLWSVETKVYEPKVSGGKRLTFALRANPVRSRRDDSGRQSRHDVVMDAKKRAEAAGETPIPLYEIVHGEGLEWLQSRAVRLGFELSKDSFRADSYQQSRFRKGERPVNISTVDFSGVLTVTDSDLFRKTLFTGIGHSKGFGCGLLTVARA